MSGGNGGGNSFGARPMTPQFPAQGGPNMQAGGQGGFFRSPPLGGAPQTGGADPLPTTAGSNTRYPPVPAGIPGSMWGQVQDRLMAQARPTVGSTEWAQSPQGLAAFGDVTSRARAMGNPVFAGAAGMMRGRMDGPGNAGVPDWAQREAQMMNRGPADFAGPPAYMGGGFSYDPTAGVQGPAGYRGAPWYDPNRTGQTMAQYIQGLPQAERDELLAKYQAAGMPNPLGGTAGTPGNPFGV